MPFDSPVEMDNDIHVKIHKQSKKQYAQTICFTLIAIMNLSSWIDLQGVFVELPLIIPLTPEGWTLPSILSLCICAANIMPAMIVFLRWYQGKRFSEIPYIYLIIIVGIISCCVVAVFWQQTTFLFGRERSVWLIGSVFTLAMLDCTSSLVFFDYMKRFRSRYLTAVFLGEGLTGAIPTLLLMIQGIGGEAICTQNGNGTILKPTFTQPRFSVTVYMFLIAGVIVTSFTAFLILQRTNITLLADAIEPITSKENTDQTNSDVSGENIPMIAVIQSFESSKPTKDAANKSCIILLLLNTITSFMFYGLLPPLSTYSSLPYGQETLYYSTLLSPLAYLFSLLLSIRWTTISTRMTIIGSVLGWVLAGFIIIIAAQSPCPWLANSLYGTIMMLISGFVTTLILGYIRFTTGNRIKNEWSDDKGMFYFGATVQLGSVVGTVPMYLLVNVFDVFTDRKPCQIYCIT